MAAHPVHVALERVDLAVVGQHAERLRQRPLRERVGGIALVIDREGALEPCIHQVGIELRHLLGQHHALVDQRTAGQRTDIHPIDASSRCCLFDPTADDIKLALELFFIQTFFVADQDLLDLRAGRVGLFAQHLSIHRDMAPAIDVVPYAQHFAFHDRAATLLCREIGAGQKYLTNRDQVVLVRFVPGALDLVIKERHRDLHMNARTVTSLAIGINRPAVPDGLERINTLFDNITRRGAVNRHNKAHTTGGMFIIVLVEAVFSHQTTLCLFGGDPVFVICCHCASFHGRGHLGGGLYARFSVDRGGASQDRCRLHGR